MTSERSHPHHPAMRRPPCVLRPRKHCDHEYVSEAQRLYSDYATFMNIPYVEHYANLEIATWITLKLNGLIPVLARDYPKEGLDRICKIIHLQWQCKYGVSDYTYGSLNVALEDMAMRKEGIQVITMHPSRIDSDDSKGFVRVVSNLLPVDPVTHGHNPDRLITRLTKKIGINWKLLFEKPTPAIISRDVYATAMKQYKEYGYEYISEFYDVIGPLLEGMRQQSEGRLRGGVENGEVS